MTGLQQTLSDFLKTDNPKTCKHEQPQRGVTKSKSNRWSEPEWIVSWEDFNHESLQSIYSGDLQVLLQSPHDFGGRLSLEPSVLAITNEDSVSALIRAWTQHYVNQALSKAQACLENNATRQNVYMVLGGQANYPGSESSFNPDWAAVQIIGSDFLQLNDPCFNIRGLKTKENARKRLPKNVLPGDSKPSKKWSSKQIVPGPVELEYQPFKDWYYPLCQIFTYCIKANIRYGYIITDEELVVLRVRPYTGWRNDLNPENHQSIGSPLFNDEEELDGDVQLLDSQRSDRKCLPDSILSAIERTDRFGVVEFKAIPWTTQNGSSNALTVNLALWWLCMLAGQKNDIQDHYPKLSDETWTERISHARSNSEKSKLVDFSETLHGGCREAKAEELQTPSRRADADAVMSNMSQGMSKTQPNPSVSYPTPDSVKRNSKRSRDARDDDLDERVCTPSRKRRNLPSLRI